MALTDDEKRALGFVELIGPVLQSIGRAASSDDIHDVGSMLAKLPAAELAHWFTRWRTDLVEITAGTMTVDDGVSVTVDNG